MQVILKVLSGTHEGKEIKSRTRSFLSAEVSHVS